jgi:hypothetical protein
MQHVCVLTQWGGGRVLSTGLDVLASSTASSRSTRKGVGSTKLCHLCQLCHLCHLIKLPHLVQGTTRMTNACIGSCRNVTQMTPMTLSCKYVVVHKCYLSQIQGLGGAVHGGPAAGTRGACDRGASVASDGAAPPRVHGQLAVHVASWPVWSLRGGGCAPRTPAPCTVGSSNRACGAAAVGQGARPCTPHIPTTQPSSSAFCGNRARKRGGTNVPVPCLPVMHRKQRSSWRGPG